MISCSPIPWTHFIATGGSTVLGLKNSHGSYRPACRIAIAILTWSAVELFGIDDVLGRIISSVGPDPRCFSAENTFIPLGMNDASRAIDDDKRALPIIIRATR